MFFHLQQKHNLQCNILTYVMVLLTGLIQIVELYVLLQHCTLEQAVHQSMTSTFTERVTMAAITGKGRATHSCDSTLCAASCPSHTVSQKGPTRL